MEIKSKLLIDQKGDAALKEVFVKIEESLWSVRKKKFLFPNKPWTQKRMLPKVHIFVSRLMRINIFTKKEVSAVLT